MTLADSSLRGLVFRLREAQTEYDRAQGVCRSADLTLGPSPADYTPEQRRKASEALGHAARVRGPIQDEILRRLRDGGVEIDNLLLGYKK